MSKNAQICKNLPKKYNQDQMTINPKLVLINF